MIKVNKTTSAELDNVVVDGQIVLTTSKRKEAWVAEIVGTHPTYKLDRKFIDEDDKGAGWKAWDLEEGKIYCLCEAKEQYFVTLKNGELNELTKKQVEELVEEKEVEMEIEELEVIVAEKELEVNEIREEYNSEHAKAEETHDIEVIKESYKKQHALAAKYYDKIEELEKLEEELKEKKREREYEILRELVRKYNDSSNREIISQQRLLIREYGMDEFDILVETIIDRIKMEEDPEYREAEIKRVNAFFEEFDEE